MFKLLLDRGGGELEPGMRMWWEKVWGGRSGGGERPGPGLERDPLAALGGLDVAGDADVVGGPGGQGALAASRVAFRGRWGSNAERGTVDFLGAGADGPVDVDRGAGRALEKAMPWIFMAW
jgi:hypothetical protein